MPDSQAPTPLHPELVALLEDRRWIVGLCRTLLSNSGDVDDLVQDTVIRGLQADALRQGAVPPRGRAWLASTARRIVWEQRRSARHRADRELRHAENAASDATVIEPPQAIARAEFRERLARLVMGLPEAEREAIVLRFYEGLDYAQMESATGVRVPALRQRVSRGLARLKVDLDADGDTAGAPWQTLALAVVAEVPGRAIAAAKLGTGKLVAAALLVVGVGVALSTWVARTAPPEVLQEAAALARASQNAEPQLVALPDSGTDEARQALGSIADAAAIDVLAQAEPTFVEVRLIDDESGAPVASQPWHVIDTGDFDLGQRSAWWTAGPSGSYYPNPEPLASGVTDADGVARFALPTHDLVNLVTERSEHFAFGSFPVEIEDGKAVTKEFRLDQGSAMFGNVVDDRGEAIVGAVFVGETYAGEPMILGTSGDGGAYRIERIANFPRSFKRVYAGGAPTGEIRPVTQRGIDMQVWPSMADFEAKSGEHGNQPYFFREPGTELERKITLSRSRTLRGIVVDQEGTPVDGAQVTLLRRHSDSVQAYLPSSLAPPSTHVAEMWDRSATTAGDGTFELPLKRRDLAQKRQSGNGFGDARSELVAAATDGRMSVQPCEPLALGEERSGIRLVLGPSQATRIHLIDPEGDVRPTSYPGALAKLSYTSSSSAKEERFHLATEGNRAEMALWPHRFPMAGSGEAKCTLLLPGYEPVLLDLSGAPSDLDITLARRPSLPLTFAVEGPGAASVESLTLRILNVPFEAPSPTSDDFQRLEDWNLEGDVRVGVQPGDPVDVLAQPGKAIYLWATMHLNYGQVRKHSSIMELAVSEAGLHATLDAPTWAAGASDHPLVKRRYGGLKVELVSADTGEVIFPWSFHAQSTGGDFTGKPRYRGAQRSFGAYPGIASLRFEAPGYHPLELGPMEFRDGETIDLDRLSMTPRDGIKGQLYQPSGEPKQGTRTLRVLRSELIGVELADGAPTEIGVTQEGAFLFDRALGEVTQVLVTPHFAASRVPAQLVPLERDEEGRLRATVHPWQIVRFRVCGLTGTSVFASAGLSITDALGLTPPVRTQHVASSTEHAFHQAELPPGRWIISAPPSSAVTFEPQEFEITPEYDPQTMTIDVQAQSR